MSLKQARSLSPSPSPTTVSNSSKSFLVHRVPSLYNIHNRITVFLIGCLLLLSLLSLCLILLLRLRCRRHCRLRGFASHSAPRLILITLVCLWAVAELLRIPLFRANLLVSSQTLICKLHVILSLGFFEPGFLVSLLFLINTSLQSEHVVAGGLVKGLAFVLSFCGPIFLILYVITYQLNIRGSLPRVFFQSATSFFDNVAENDKVVLCIYPLLSGVVFGVFGVLYIVVVLCKCWKVISMAINKRLASRINLLSLTLLVCLALQVVLMSLSVFFNPTHATYYLVVFIIFVSVLVCAAVGEYLLVIIPILEALSTVVGHRPPDEKNSGNA